MSPCEEPRSSKAGSVKRHSSSKGTTPYARSSSSLVGLFGGEDAEDVGEGSGVILSSMRAGLLRSKFVDLSGAGDKSLLMLGSCGTRTLCERAEYFHGNENSTSFLSSR